MMSPESMVRMGGRLASYTPSRTVSLVEGTTCTRPSALGSAHGPAPDSCACASLREPRLDSGQHTHEAARLQELAAPAAARRQIAVKSSLIDLVHVEEAIGGAIVKGGVLDILADDTCSLLVAAAEEIGAGVMVKVLRRMFVGLVGALGT